MNRLFKASGLLLYLFWLLPASAAPQFAGLSGRVVDNAGLLSSNKEAQRSELLAAHENASSNQLAVATVDNLAGYDIASYGYQLGRFWGIGQNDKNNGVVLLIPLLLKLTPFWLESNDLLVAHWVTFILLASVFRIPAIMMRLVPKRVKHWRASSLARRQFLENNLHHTHGGTGLLIFVSAASTT